MSALGMWHLLSLDAPSVATLWTWYIAWCCGLNLPWTALAAMFVAVWMLYVADRLLDARALGADETVRHGELEARHYFHNQHRRAFVAGFVFAAVALGLLAPRLHAEALRLYSLLAALLLVWLLLVHGRLGGARRLPKELAVGVFFPAATFIPTVARLPQMRTALIVPALLLAAVCALNCLLVYAWEHPGDADGAHWTTRFASRRPGALTVVMACLSGADMAALWPGSGPGRLFALPAACGVSALLLGLLHRKRRWFGEVDLRASADAALLTPLVLAPLVRLWRG